MHRLHAPLLAAALFAMLLSAGSAAAAPKPVGHSAGPSETIPIPVTDGPDYPVKPCCRLCPRAADPASYDTSGYLNDFRMLQEGTSGWLFRSGLDLTTTFEITDESLSELHRFADALRRRGTELMIIYQPPRGLMDPDHLQPQQLSHYDIKTARRNYATALQRIRSAGVIVPPLDQLVDKDEPYDYFFRRDHHWTPAGAEHTAKLVAQTISTLPLYTGLPKKDFVTRKTGLLAKPGTLQKVATDLCGGGWSLQYVSAFQTVSGSEGGGADLLGDTADPDVVLIGTSNSDAKGGYNFGGYLQQYTRVDILNDALTGGSFDGSLLHYLPSESFQKHPPKLLIWEMPYQNYPDSNKSPHRTYRQAVALLGNGCVGKPAILTKTANLKVGSNEILFNGGGRLLDITGRNAQIDVQFDDPSVKDMRAVIWYFNGLKETLNLHFNQYVDNGGRFVAELRNNRPDYVQAGFLSMTLEIDPPLNRPLKATTTLCARETAAGHLRTASQ